MRRIIAILGSLALGLILAGFGLILNAWILIYSGVGIFVLMAALWLYTWASPVRVEVPVYVPATAPESAEPEPSNPKAKALATLKKARDNAAVAVRQGNAQTNERAYDEIVAALLTIKREFGFGPLILSGKGKVPFPALLKALVTYIDRILPLLREGHVDEARNTAAKFGWQFQDSDEGFDAMLRAPRADPPKASTSERS